MLYTISLKYVYHNLLKYQMVFTEVSIIITEFMLNNVPNTNYHTISLFILRFWQNLIHCSQRVNSCLHPVLRPHDNFIITTSQQLVLINKFYKHILQLIDIRISFHDFKVRFWRSNSSFTFSGFWSSRTFSFLIQYHTSLTVWNHRNILNSFNRLRITS